MKLFNAPAAGRSLTDEAAQAFLLMWQHRCRDLAVLTKLIEPLGRVGTAELAGRSLLLKGGFLYYRKVDVTFLVGVC